MEEHVWFDYKARPIKIKITNNRTAWHRSDITKKIRLEQELKESEANIGDFLRMAYDGIYAHDTEGYFTSANKSVLKILGETQEKNL